MSLCWHSSIFLGIGMRGCRRRKAGVGSQRDGERSRPSGNTANCQGSRLYTITVTEGAALSYKQVGGFFQDDRGETASSAKRADDPSGLWSAEVL